MSIGSLFTGIGGIDLGLEACGLGPVAWQCEIDPAARAVLAANFPAIPCFDDIRSIDGNTDRVDVLCGGFPCQPHSLAGKRRGTSDERWLWPEFARVVGVLRPHAVLIENVPGLRTSGLRDVLADLAGLGFDAEWDLFSAEEVGAPHRRRRLFILAYSDGFARWFQPWRSGRTNGACAPVTGFDGNARPVADADGAGLEKRGEQSARSERPAAERGRPQTVSWPVEPDVGRVAHGVPARVDRLRMLGNACVPAQAALAWRELSSRAVPA